MSRRCGSSKPTPTPLTVWLRSQEHAKKSIRRKRRPYNKAKATHQKPAAYRWCGAGGSEKALEPAAYRRCGRGGQERLYGKPTTKKGTVARRALVDMDGNTGANTREKSCKKNSRGPSAWRGVTKKRQILGMGGGRTYSPPKPCASDSGVLPEPWPGTTRRFGRTKREKK